MLSSSSVGRRSSAWSRSTSISAACCSSSGTEGRKTDAVSPRRRARTKRPTAWAKNSGVDGGRRVDADRQPWDVDTLRDHPDGHHPAGVAGRERLDPRAGAGLVGQHDRRRLAGDPAQLRGVGAGRQVVGGDHQAAGVRHAPPYLGEPPVGRREHLRDPVALRVQRGPPGRGREVLGQRLPEDRGDLVAGPGAPAHLAGVGQEDHRPDDAVGQRPPVAVGVVGGRPPDPVATVGVRDERDRAGVGPERRARQGQSAGGRLEGLPHGITPGQGITTVMDLVEDHQGPLGLGTPAVQQRVRGDLGVGHRDAGEVAADGPLAVAEARVQADADPGRRVGPLVLEVLGRRHHGHRVDQPALEQLAGDPEGEGRLAGAGRRDREEVAVGRADAGQVGVESLLLPGAERVGDAPGGAEREGGREVGCGSGTHRWDEANGVPRTTCRPLQVSREPAGTC